MWRKTGNVPIYSKEKKKKYYYTILGYCVIYILYQRYDFWCWYIVFLEILSTASVCKMLKLRKFHQPQASTSSWNNNQTYSEATLDHNISKTQYSLYFWPPLRWLTMIKYVTGYDYVSTLLWTPNTPALLLRAYIMSRWHHTLIRHYTKTARLARQDEINITSRGISLLYYSNFYNF